MGKLFIYLKFFFKYFHGYVIIILYIYREGKFPFLRKTKEE